MNNITIVNEATDYAEGNIEAKYENSNKKYLKRLEEIKEKYELAHDQVTHNQKLNNRFKTTNAFFSNMSDLFGSRGGRSSATSSSTSSLVKISSSFSVGNLKQGLQVEQDEETLSDPICKLWDLVSTHLIKN